MYLRLLAESMRRGTRRKLLAVTAVALGTLGATALGEVMLASGDRLASDMGSYGANIEILPAAGRGTLPVDDLGRLRTIFWRNNVAAFAPFHSLRVRFAGAGGVVAPLSGTWFDHSLPDGFRTGLPATRPTLKVNGRWPREGAAEAVLGRRLAERLGVTVGGEVRAEVGGRGASFRVVGLLTSGGEEDEEAYVPLAEVGRLSGQPGRFTRAEVFALTNPERGNVRNPKTMTPEQYDTWYCTAYPSSVAFQIGEALPQARVEVVHGVAAATADVLDRLRGVLLALAVVALAGAAVGVTAAMTATVLERRLEAGLLVAIGAPRRRVVLFFLSEAALLGGLGGLAGGLLGLPAGRLLGSTVLGVAVPWVWVLLPFAALLGLLVAILASLAPVTRALGRYPAAILKRATA
ncbi:MAG TPA: ABC transporter permease [Thermoanaerobaculia bacterium]|nr:ABC transporter permease [Thermoanaerobaculia bacterium]